jgi:hypothetical protein
LFITDIPDFDKKHLSDIGIIQLYLAKFFPVYQIPSAGFFIKDTDLKKRAKKVGFRDIVRYDSWSNYRSHWILKKV